MSEDLSKIATRELHLLLGLCKEREHYWRDVTMPNLKPSERVVAIVEFQQLGEKLQFLIDARQTP